MTDAPQQPAPAAPEQPQAPPPQQPLTPPGAGPAKPDYTMAWLPHLLMVLTGWLGPLIIWLVKKDEDKLAAFHGKQALCWALGVNIVVIGVAVFGMILIAITRGALRFALPCLVGLVYLGNLAYGIYAIIQTSKGEPFKYFFVADQFCAKEFAEAHPAQPPAGQ